MNTEPGHCVVNDEYCFIFIPKCASHTLAYALVDAGGRHAHFIKEPKVLDLTIAVLLRDPLERFVSAYNYPGWHQAPETLPTPEECIGMQDGHFAHQYWYLDGNTPDIVRDLSNIEDFAKCINVQFPMVWRNSQFEDRFEQHRTPELEQKIKDFYKPDYALRARLL